MVRCDSSFPFEGPAGKVHVVFEEGRAREAFEAKALGARFVAAEDPTAALSGGALPISGSRHGARQSERARATTRSLG